MSSPSTSPAATTSLSTNPPLWPRAMAVPETESEGATPALAQQLALFQLEIAPEEASQAPAQSMVHSDSAKALSPATLPPSAPPQPRRVRSKINVQARPKPAWPTELAQPTGYALYGFTRIEVATNCRRSYQIAYQPSLFAHHVIQRVWGRLGSLKQRTLEQEFATSEEALRALARALKRRLARGYVLQWAEGQTENESKEPGVA